jgi:hypothetical protein
MRAMQINEWGKPLEAREYPDPEPAGEEVLLRVESAGVCHSDVHIWDGFFDLGDGRQISLESRGVRLPFTMAAAEKPQIGEDFVRGCRDVRQPARDDFARPRSARRNEPCRRRVSPPFDRERADPGTDGSQTLPWREVDSNHRFLVGRSNSDRRRAWLSRKGSGSVGELKVRIHLPPAASQERTVRLPGTSVQKGGCDCGVAGGDPHALATRRNWTGSLATMNTNGAAVSFAWSGAQTLIAQLAEGDAGYLGKFSFFARLGSTTAPILAGAVWDYSGAWPAYLVFAARLEALAEPGGICISRVVRDQIRDKLPYRFEDIGEQSVKNITRPVRAYAMNAAAVALLPSVVAVVEPVVKEVASPKRLSP